MAERLTNLQAESLLWLVEMHMKHPGNSAGFNPPHRNIAAAFRRMEPRGLVQVNRIAPEHFRYAITKAGFDTLWSAGRQALRGGKDA